MKTFRNSVSRACACALTFVIALELGAAQTVISTPTLDTSSGPHYSGLRFTCDCTVGNQGEVTIVDDGITVDAGKTVDFLAILHGAYDITVDGGGTLHLKGLNDFTAALTLSNVTFWAYSAQSFGWTASSSPVTLAGPETGSSVATRVVFADGTKTSDRKPLRWAGSPTAATVALEIPDNATVTLNNAFVPSREGSLLGAHFGAGSKTVFNGHIGELSASAWTADPTATVYLNGGWTGTAARFTGGTWVMTNRFQSALYEPPDLTDGFVIPADTTVSTPVANLFCSAGTPATLKTVVVRLCGTYAAPYTAHWDLAGCDQIVNALAADADDDGSTTSCRGEITSEKAATLTVKGDVPVTSSHCKSPYWNVRFTGKASLAFTGSRPAILNAASTSSGTLSLSGGSDVTFSPDASWAGLTVNVTGGSKLTVQNENAFDPLALVSVSGNGSQLVLDEADLCVKAMSLGGVALKTGVYGAVGTGSPHESVFLGGTGHVIVYGNNPPTTKVWTGLGFDPAYYVHANWLDMSSPFDNGLDSVIFRGGTRSSLDQLANVRALTFDATNATFAVGTASAKSMTVGDGGLVATNSHDAAARAYAITAPFVFGASQKWSVAPGCSLALTGPVSSGVNGLELDVENGGTIAWSSSSGSYAVTAAVVGGTNLVTSGAALGASGSSFTFARPEDSTAPMTVAFSGTTLRAALEFRHGDAADGDLATMIRFGDAATNVFRGAVSVVGEDTARLRLGNAADVSFSGGFTANVPHLFFGPVDEALAAPSVRFAEGAFAPVGSVVFGGSGEGPVVDLRATGTFRRLLKLYGTARLTAHAENALNGTSDMASGTQNPAYLEGSGLEVTDRAVLDLNGFDQTVGSLYYNPNGPVWQSGSADAEVTSPTQAVLHVTDQRVKSEWATPFTGWAMLSMAGTGTIVLTAVNPSRGTEMEIRSGTLQFGPTALWKALKRITVGALKKATLRFDADSQVHKNCEIILLNGSKIHVEEGITAHVGIIWIDDEQLPAGRYTAQTRPDLVEGDGAVYCLGLGGSGFSVHLR